MSKMKHLLRKLHIGGDHPPPHHHHSPPSPPSSPPPPPPPPPEEPSSSAAMDFDFLEEEFQVQLALAISASDTGGVGGGDAETAQIKAAKQISLGRSPIDEGPVESLSLSYWSYNFVNYDEKLMDGFYDVYTPSNLTVQGKMPLLQDLQEIPNSDNIEYEVVSVNRITDPNLCQLEEIVYAASMEYLVLENGQTINRLIQKIADLVVNRMGGPVNNADEMIKMWNIRSYELRTSLNSIVLPLGCIDVGLSRHRALLFKVLADRINLPCMLVKGSYYTGTDEGAVNLIKFDSGSEFVIDLMGAPGALIPAELSSEHLQNSDLNIKSCSNYSETIKDLSPVLEEGNQVISPLETSGSSSGEGSGVKVQSNNRVTDLYNANQTEKFETDFGSLFPSFCRSNEGLFSDNRKTTDAHKLKVDDVSKYVISASENPHFAHKLHAVLVESGSSESTDFLLGALPQNVKDMDKKLDKVESGYGFMSSKLVCPSDTTDETFKLVNNESNSPIVADRLGNCLFPFAAELNEGECKENLIGGFCFEDKKGKETDNVESKSSLALINPLLGDASSWEISWEELQIGERIGLGSFGEVYHAEWNSTEVAVKKFMDQDISGDALTQFKCEVEIMLRLRHPNLVLFMGAVTRPPNLSILTEYLPRGSLFKLLHRPNNHLSEKRRLRMAIDVAKGMNYLHTSHPTIVHRDLKTPNLLVDKNWVVKVCDFGLSRLKHHAFLSSKSAAGTPEWMAPEVLRNEQSNEKSDVYSFGVILWELATLRVPWSGMNSMQVIGAVGFQDRHLDVTDDIDPTVSEIILQCWHPKSQMRPSFGDLIKRLRRLKRLQCPVAQITNPQSG